MSGLGGYRQRAGRVGLVARSPNDAHRKSIARDERSGHRSKCGAETHLVVLRAHSSIRRKRSAFAITDTDERLIAALAIIGESNQPVIG